MTAPASTGRKSVDELAFEHYLRTGEQLTSTEWRERFEMKYNHNHDERGRFTFAFGGGVGVRAASTVHAGRAAQTLVGKPAHAPVALDSLSKAEETTDGDPGTISSGQGDNGGISYGPYQLSTNKGKVAEFVASTEAKRWAEKFKGLTPGSEAFNQQWDKVAASDPTAFGAAQKAFVVRSNYGQTERMLAQSPATDIRGAGSVVKAVVYSTAVQHGPTGGTRIIKIAIAETDRVLKRGDPRWQSVLISQIYAGRIKNALAISKKFGADGKNDSAKTYMNIATIRLPRERDRALSMLIGA